MRNAISIGGDSDTIGCITGAIAEALFGVPQWMGAEALSRLPQPLHQIVQRFTTQFSLTQILQN